MSHYRVASVDSPLLEMRARSHPHPLYRAVEHPILSGNGLNLLAVFDVASLPAQLQQLLQDAGVHPYRQLLLIGNGGAEFWQCSQEFTARTDHPVDEFAEDVVRRFMVDAVPNSPYQMLYPGPALVPLQTLGQLAGWHHPTPFMVGINDAWGSWYAYRAALVADTEFDVSTPVPSVSPCQSCHDKPCIQACPAGALNLSSGFSLDACLDHRTAPVSSCADTCLARLACPVASQHRYSDAQIRYHYRHSLAHVVQWRETQKTEI